MVGQERRGIDMKDPFVIAVILTLVVFFIYGCYQYDKQEKACNGVMVRAQFGFECVQRGSIK